MAPIIPDQQLPRRSESGMATRAVNAAARVLLAAMEQGRETATGLAIALDSACLLNSPEAAAELEALRALAAEYERPADEAPIASALTPKALASADKLTRLLAPVQALREDCDVEAATEVEQLRARVAELEAERHTTNEALSEAAETLRSNRDRIAQLEKAAVEGRAALASFCYDWADPGTAALGALFLLQQATIGAPMEPGETELTIYRASHDAIVMGHYISPDAAREHCETLMRREWPNSILAWTEDDEDGVAELVAMTRDGAETDTGYVVTPLEVAAAYDETADE